MSPAGATATQRVAESFALRLDGSGAPTTGLVSGASGGVFTAEVIQHQSGSDPFARKMLGPPRYEDIEIEVGAAMPAPLFDWIAASWGASPPSMDGALLAFDRTFKLQREQRFLDALIAETAFPALDAASKQIGRIGVRITPRELLPPAKPPPGTQVGLTLGKSPHKAWQVAAFKLELEGLSTTRVARIDAFAIRRSIEISRGAGSTITPGRIVFPNLRVWLAASGADDWYAWHRHFLIDGHNTDADEKDGAIVLLAANLSPIATIELHGVGIFRIAPAPRDTEGMPGPMVARVVADLYCERMQLVAGGA
jgi:hypothetical protein